VAETLEKKAADRLDGIVMHYKLIHPVKCLAQEHNAFQIATFF